MPGTTSAGPAPSASRSAATSRGLHTSPSAPAAIASRASRRTCWRRAAGDADRREGRRVQAGQHGDRQQQRPSGAGRLGRAARRLDHRGAPRRVHRQHPGASGSTARTAPATVFGMSCSLRSRNTGRSPIARTPGRAVGQEELEPELEQPAMGRDRQRERLARPRSACRGQRSAGCGARPPSSTAGSRGGRQRRRRAAGPAAPAPAPPAPARSARPGAPGAAERVRRTRPGAPRAGTRPPCRPAPRPTAAPRSPIPVGQRPSRTGCVFDSANTTSSSSTGQRDQ